jgi:hypothetical protein
MCLNRAKASQQNDHEHQCPGVETKNLANALRCRNANELAQAQHRGLRIPNPHYQPVLNHLDRFIF